MYEKLFNLSLDPLCIAGTDGYFKKVNPAFTKTLGYSKDEFLSKPFLDFVHPDDKAATIKQMENSEVGIDIIKFENRYLHKNGKYRDISWQATTDLKGDEALIYAVARDITDSKKNELAFKQLQSILEAHTIIAATDKAGNITEVNDRFCKISGYSEKELIGQNHRIVNSGMHSKEFFKEIWQTISNGKVWTGIINNKSKQGHIYNVYSIIYPVLNSRAEVTKYRAIRFDLTEYIGLKKQLDRTLDILNETSSIAKVGGWELDAFTRELNWTNETFNILEFDKKNDQRPMLPDGLELFTPASKVIVENAVNEALEKGTPYSLEVEALTAKGNKRWVFTSGKANYKNGKIVSLSGVIQDINDRKLTEKKYELEKMKSFQSSKLASLGEMSAGVAHEINNPLTVISCSIELFHKFKDDPEKFDKYVEAIKKSSARIEKIVSSLKKFSRMEASAKRICNLHELIGEVITLTDSKVKRGDVLLKYEKNTSNDILIKCDEVEIEQVIINLINNAVDAIEQLEERWIEILIENTDKNALLYITDSGHGIPVDIAERMFEPFYTTKEVGKGTGLGLSLIHI